MNANSQNVFNAIQSSVISQSVSSSKNEVKLICTSNFMGREIKVYGSAENPLFLAKDVAEWIDYSKSGNGSYNITQMLSSVDEDEKMIRTIRTDDTTKNVSREVWLLTEDGLYDVLMLSRKPIAKQFKKGVKEILKTIRKTGSYSVTLPSYQISDPIKRAEKWIEEETIRQQLALENKMMKPKADYFDALVDRNMLTNLRDTAKQIHIPQNKFISLLIDNKYLYRDAKEKLKPYSQFVPTYFELKDFSKNGHAGTQLLVTPRGKETFRLMWGGDGYAN